MQGTHLYRYWIATVVLWVGCSTNSSSGGQPPPPHGSQYGQPAPPGYPHQPAPGQPGQPPPGHTPTHQPPPQTAQPAPPQHPAGAAQPAAANQAHTDFLNRLDTALMRNLAQSILAELVAALPAQQQARVQGIPLVFDPEPGEVNAFAACTRQGQSLMALSDGILEVSAFLAKSQANDELFGSAKVDEYVQLIARQQRPGQPLVRPPAGFFQAAHHSDPRRLTRQRALFEEELAFILGHELAHHYLGHLPCTAGGAVGVTTAELNHALSSALPLLNQPNELASDVSGTQNVLTAGSRRTGHRWTEAGGLLTMRFFGGLQRLTPADLLFAFERSHPPALVRTPVIQQTAAAWRATGGASIALPF